jgi:uncharacterized Fe-S cluster protein YjdI/CDGSH-type Zn-finger protein
MAERDYRTDEIVVHWDSSRCIHTGICLRSLHQVFNLRQTPWVDVGAAGADEIATTIEKCPSGALTYTRLDGPGETPPATTTVVPNPGGPLFVRGDVEVRDSDGELMGAGYRMTLCRCGHSQNQPFCDLTHRDVGFTDNPRVIADHRREADDPSGVSGKSAG